MIDISFQVWQKVLMRKISLICFGIVKEHTAENMPICCLNMKKCYICVRMYTNYTL